MLYLFLSAILSAKDCRAELARKKCCKPFGLSPCCMLVALEVGLPNCRVYHMLKSNHAKIIKISYVFKQ